VIGLPEARESLAGVLRRGSTPPQYSHIMLELARDMRQKRALTNE
jgi:hypothetical protein